MKKEEDLVKDKAKHTEDQGEDKIDSIRKNWIEREEMAKQKSHQFADKTKHNAEAIKDKTVDYAHEAK